MSGQGQERKIAAERGKFPACLLRKGEKNGKAAGAGADQNWNQSGQDKDQTVTSPCSLSFKSAREDSNMFSYNESQDESANLQQGPVAENPNELLFRIKQLEELLKGKDEALLTLTQEMEAIGEVSCVDASVGPLTLGIEAEYKAQLDEYHGKLQEYSDGLAQKDAMIEKLADTLKQSVLDREVLQNRAIELAEQVQSLQAQLQIASHHAQEPQEKLLELLKVKESELQKKSADLIWCKTQSAKEVQSLMSSLEEMQQQHTKTSQELSQQIKLEKSHEEDMAKLKENLRQRYEEDTNKVKKELVKAQKVESVLRSQLQAAHGECERLTLELSTRMVAHEAEVASLKDQMESVLTQLNESLASKNQLNNVLVEKENLCHHLNKEMESLKEKLKMESEKALKINEEAERLQSHLEAKTLNLAAMKDEVKTLDSKLSQAHQLLEDNRRQLQSDQNKHSGALAQREEIFCTELKQLNEKMAEMKRTHSRELDQIRQKLLQNDRNHEEEVSILQRNANLKQEQIERFEQELELKVKTSLQDSEQILGLQNQLRSVKEMNGELKQQVQGFTQQIKAEKDEVESCRKRIDCLEEEKKELYEQCSSHKQIASELSKNLEKEHERVSALTEETNRMHDQCLSEKMHHNAHTEELLAANNDFQKTQENYSVQVTKLEEQLKLATQQLKAEENMRLLDKSTLQSLSTELEQERNLSLQSKEVIEELKQELKDLSASLESCYQDLEIEKETSSSLTSQIDALQQKLGGTLSDLEAFRKENEALKCTVDTLKSDLNQEKTKSEVHNQEAQKLHLQLEENINLAGQYKSQIENLQGHLERIHKFHAAKIYEYKQQQDELADDSMKKAHVPQQASDPIPRTDEPAPEISCVETLCETYRGHVQYLNMKISSLHETNLQLTERKKNTEDELARFQSQYAEDTEKLESILSGLRKEIAAKDEEIHVLLKRQDEVYSQKDSINSFNQEMKDLLSSKASLETELDKCQNLYDKEVTFYKEKVALLEKQIDTLLKKPDLQTLYTLVQKCHSDIGALQSFYQSDVIRKQLMEGDQLVGTVDQVCDSGTGNNVMLNGGGDAEQGKCSQDYCELRSKCEELLTDNNSLRSKLRVNEIMGISAIEKLLDVSKKALKDIEENKCQEKYEASRLSFSLAESAVHIEKLEFLLRESSNKYQSLQEQCNKLDHQNGTLLQRVKDLQSEITNMKKDETQSAAEPELITLPVSLSGWIQKCSALEANNSKLIEEMDQLQLKLNEVQAQLDSVGCEPLDEYVPFKLEFMGESSKTDQECEKLQSLVQSLRKELLEKQLSYEEKIRSVLEEQCFGSHENNTASLRKLISELFSNSKEIILLKDKLTAAKVENSTLQLTVENQSNQLAQSHSILKEAWEECFTLKRKLQNVHREVDTLRARVKHLDSHSIRSKLKEGLTQQEVCQMLEDVTVALNKNHTQATLTENASTPPVVVKIQSAMKISNTIFSEYESLLVKLQEEESQKHVWTQLRSEALSLRRLHALLQETEQAILSRSGPALQLHVDILLQQLKDKDSCYQDICDAHFSLEAEMREREEEVKQQEDCLQKELLKEKIQTKLLELKLEALLLSQVHNAPQSETFLDNILSQLENFYECSLQKMLDLGKEEIALNEAKLQKEFEQKQKEAVEDLVKEIHLNGDVNHLETLHKQELIAVQAEHKYAVLKQANDLHKQLNFLPNLLDHRNSSSISHLALDLMKQQLSAQYGMICKKTALDCQNECQKIISSLEDHFTEINSTKDLTNNEDVIIGLKNILNDVELSVSKIKEIGKNLVEELTTGVKRLLCTLEDHHQCIMLRVEEINNQLEAAGEVQMLQTRLKNLEEEHRLALNSMSEQHKAETNQLRQMINQTAQFGREESNESAVSSLRRELEEKHTRQMEELRTYFEQKCADFEKHYSEEVFSQHSRKLSDCSSASESELVSEMYYAGPGSSASAAPAAPVKALPHFSSASHLCDSLGESSFRELEEPIQAKDFEKLLLENREKIETVRLALESRYQAELEAQREVYETKVAELLRNMCESHNAELHLQSKKLQEMQDTEKLLNTQLNAVMKRNEELNSLVHVLKQEVQAGIGNSSAVHNKASENKNSDHDGLKSNANWDMHYQKVLVDELVETDGDAFKCYMETLWKNRESELKSEIQKMANALKLKDTESSAQIATLKTKLRQNHDVMSKLEKDISNSKTQNEEELNSLRTTLKEKIDLIQDLTSQMQKYKTEQTLGDKFSSELEMKKAQLDAEYSEYLEFVKKCADDTKQQLIEQHDGEMAKLRIANENALSSVHSTHEKQLSELRIMYESQLRDLNVKLELAQESASSKDKVHKAKDQLEKLLDERAVSSLPPESLIELYKQCEAIEAIPHPGLDSSLREDEGIIAELRAKVDELQREQEARVLAVQEECEQRFHSQLEEARTDIVQALERHIQQLLDDTDGEKPLELQQLENKLSSKYHLQLIDLRKEHELILTELKERHTAELTELQQKSSGPPTISSEELRKLRIERDCLRNVAATLRDVVAELVRYFMSCEDEFNNTLMDELAKLEADEENELLCLPLESPATPTPTHAIAHDTSSLERDRETKAEEHQNTSESGEEMSVIIATPAKKRRSSVLNIKRVHFAPDVSGILSLIDDGSLLESVGVNNSIRDVSLNFHEELDRCLSRLRHESAALLAISKSTSSALPSEKDEINHLRSEIENMRASKEQLSSHLTSAQSYVKELQADNEELHLQAESMREEQEALLLELQSMRQRLEALENSAHQAVEVVAEGYGEGHQSMNSSDFPTSPRATSLEALQDKARTLLLGATESGLTSPNTSQQLPHVVDELCRDWERLSEDARRKQDDLVQQVEAADKQLRSTRAFLDEQALEREQERDEFLREIKKLQNLLRDKDRDRSSQNKINHEVEELENQLKEAQGSLKETLEKLHQVEADRNQAVEKIWTLRDIISDLEGQVATKSETAATVQAQNETLQRMLDQQGRTQLELAQEMEALQLGSWGTNLTEHISKLEEQLRKHQLQAEQFLDSSAMIQMRSQLRDLETSLDARTKELERAHASMVASASPCLSSPSEDVSIRDAIEALREKSRNESDRVTSPITIPVDEVSRIQDNWQRHLRADDAVMKKIRDLDMQLEDVQAERNVLAARLQEQMLQVSALQTKLDEHRHKADVKLSETTQGLHSLNEELRSEVLSVSEKLETKEQQIKVLESALQQANSELKKRESDLKSSIEAERSVVVQLQSQVTKLSGDKDKLKALLSGRNEPNVSLPTLVESMLADKNADIDRLEKQVQHLTKQMELSSQYVITPSTTLEFEYREPEKLRANVELSPMLELRRSLSISKIDFGNTELKDSTQLQIGEPSPSHSRFDPQPISEHVEPVFVQSVTQSSLKPLDDDALSITQKSTDTSESVSSTKEDTNITTATSCQSLSDCEKQLAAMESTLDEKTTLLKKLEDELKKKENLISQLKEKCKNLAACEVKLAEMSSMEEELKHLRSQLQDTAADVSKDRELFETQLQSKDKEIQSLRDEVCATQAIVSNLQSKVQEAKEIARSPSNRPSTDNKLALQTSLKDLKAAQCEVAQLKEKCLSIRVEVENEYRQRQSELEDLVQCEQETVKSLQHTIGKMQNQLTTVEKERMMSVQLKEQVSQARVELQQKEEEMKHLQDEINHLNLECVTLKQQLSVPLNEATNLASKLEAEKKFAQALKEELSLCKTKVINLEDECCSLKSKFRTAEMNSKEADKYLEENKIMLEEMTGLKQKVSALEVGQTTDRAIIQKLTHEKVLLSEENVEVAKELSDLKRSLKQKHEEPKKHMEQILLAKTVELDKVVEENKVFSRQLSSLRIALQNIDSQIDYFSLTKDDFHMLCKLQKRLGTRKHKTSQDGRLSRLSASEVDICEIEPDVSHTTVSDSGSLDDLTGMVKHELDVSVRLDDSLLQTLEPLGTNNRSSGSRPTGSIQPSSQTGELFSVEARHRPQLLQPLDKSSKGELQVLDHSGVEWRKVRQLENELSKERASVQILQNQLEAERARYDSLQQQDSDLIEAMRRKLELALDTEAKLRAQVQIQIHRRQDHAKDMGDVLPPEDLQVTLESHSQSREPSNVVKDLETQVNVLSKEVEKLTADREIGKQHLRRLQEAEVRRSRRRAATEEQHRRQIDQLQTFLSEAQQESCDLRQQLSAAQQDLLTVRRELTSERESQLRGHTPFLERLKNMNAFLEDHISENVRMAKQMEEFTEEHRQLRSQIAQLEQQLGERHTSESFEVARRRFSSERAEWETERQSLIQTVNELQQSQSRSPGSEVEDRVNHLFGRYLRAESYRKALIWQKRYLLIVIEGHQETQNLAASHLLDLNKNVKRTIERRSALQRFRSAAFVIIAIHRMNFMVDRWLRGRRIGSGVVLNQPYRQLSRSAVPIYQATTTHETLMVKEEYRSSRPQRLPTVEKTRPSDLQHLNLAHPPRSLSENKPPGTSSGLAECIASFQLLQQRFDAVLSRPPQ